MTPSGPHSWNLMICNEINDLSMCYLFYDFSLNLKFKLDFKTFSFNLTLF